MGDLLALSFLQPWLTEILEHVKGCELGGDFYAIENRRWKPPRGMIGRTFALHASAGWDRDGAIFIAALRAGKPEPQTVSEALALEPFLPAKDVLPRSAILGTARLVGAFNLLHDSSDARARHVNVSNVAGDPPRGSLDLVGTSDWSFGPWCWLLADVRKLREPIQCKGALGFWKVPADVAERAHELEVAHG